MKTYHNKPGEFYIKYFCKISCFNEESMMYIIVPSSGTCITVIYRFPLALPS